MNKLNIEDMKYVTVIGAGAMGHSIAQVALMSGFRVSLFDINDEIVEKGKTKIEWSLKKFVEKVKISEDDYKKFLNNLTLTTDLKEASKYADLCIEAAPEKLDLKMKIFSDLDKSVPGHAILASNTSTMSITKIGSVTQRPGKVIGMHYFNPPVLMPLIEIVMGEKTSEETLKIVTDFTKKSDKTPIVSIDSPGFICNRVVAPGTLLLNLMLDQKEYPPEKIDAAALHLGSPIGPYQLQDYLGLDVVYDSMEYLSERLSKDYSPTPTMKRLIKANKLGKKTGEGIYDWKTGKPEINTSDPADFDMMIPMRVQINEAAKILEEGIGTANDIDTGIKLAFNNPLGPFELVENINLAELTELLDGLADKYGKEVFRAHKWIRNGTLMKHVKTGNTTVEAKKSK
ncbi:MAG: 3-hydroxyacyl-CoA dehydrogenase NAD-binding domain-containing protein [Candidatus Hodarchaeales archaeon]